MKLGIVCLLSFLILGCNKSPNNKIDLDAVFVTKFDYKKKFDRFWYINTIYIDKNNQTYQFIQSADCLVGHSSSSLDEENLENLENLEILRNTSIELVTSVFYRDFFSKKDGYHVGGDIYTYSTRWF